MDVKAILFDLDGTLLPMDQDLFMKYYFEALAKKLVPLEKIRTFLSIRRVDLKN